MGRNKAVIYQSMIMYLILSSILLSVSINCFKTTIMTYRSSITFVDEFNSYKSLSRLLRDLISENSFDIKIADGGKTISFNKYRFSDNGVEIMIYKIRKSENGYVLNIYNPQGDRNTMFLSDKPLDIKFMIDGNTVNVTYIYKSFIFENCIGIPYVS